MIPCVVAGCQVPQKVTATRCVAVKEESERMTSSIVIAVAVYLYVVNSVFISHILHTTVAIMRSIWLEQGYSVSPAFGHQWHDAI